MSMDTEGPAAPRGGCCCGQSQEASDAVKQGTALKAPVAPLSVAKPGDKPATAEGSTARAKGDCCH